MFVAVVCTVVCAVAVVLLLATTRGGAHRPEWMLKPIAATSFVAAAIAWGALDGRFGTVLLIGLALSWCGDVLLIGRGKGSFLAGLVAFLLGHVAYAVAFALRGVAWGATAAAAAATAIVLVPVGRWLLPAVERAMKAPVLAYMLVISTMVALAVGTVAAHGNPWILVGAVAFYLSDLAVARDRFVARGWINRVWGLPLYFGAQLVLAWCAGQP
jgi:uncharacterized membrane protein YhhN